jgi:hypothetical protein
MKNSLLFIVFSVLIFSSCNGCRNEGSETGENANDSNGTNSENYTDNINSQEYSLPAELEYGRVGKDYLYDKFYPIGWSKNGKFAYIVEPADEASGLYWFEIIIMDVVNKKTVWSWKPDESEEGNIETTWQENYDLFKKHLSESEIIQQSKLELKPVKSTYKGNDYKLVLDVVNITDPDFGFEVVKESKIRIESEQLGNKLIASIKEETYSRVIGAILPGYLQSPYDDRIVVVFRKERVGYEGPPNVVYFELFGSDMTRGFKKSKES